MLLPWLFRVGRSGLRTDNLWLYAVRAAFAYSAMFCGYYSVRLITIADSVALQFTLPIFTLVFAVILLKERAYAHRWIATVLGFAGVLIIVRPGFAEVNIGVAIALAAALLFGVVDVSTRFLARDDGIRTILFYGFILQLPIAVIPAAATMGHAASRRHPVDPRLRHRGAERANLHHEVARRGGGEPCLAGALSPAAAGRAPGLRVFRRTAQRLDLGRSGAAVRLHLLLHVARHENRARRFSLSRLRPTWGRAGSRRPR